MGFISRSRKSLHRWAVWTLVEDHLEDPSGGAFVRTYVDSPGAVGVVVLHVNSLSELKGAHLSEVKTTLVRQFRAPFGEDMWEIPAGMRDVDSEPPELTAHRELAEEAGLEASVLVHLGSMASAPGITNSMVEIFCCMWIARSAYRPSWSGRRTHAGEGRLCRRCARRSAPWGIDRC